ncbi:undecaprenyl-phosphate galactose phosphotransferase WbaP [Deinococcus arenicola]|uniref:Undecaprenyl-phosphate galactose phosphotransferase WbaP n=1 Tax=Deinococcus arenicola TaxID=2994950 RepID=A0ABU4DTB9_9DEIO|nr:undecaprenyl-phosphate galactose phosphotransferase WbaP [Deinococcus sp. ZS9-10]MDV6375675.1 undecaprenyl-phosphate galactose phosphotransferase WbaP [Deinococcus sp. ZS9-10]
MQAIRSPSASTSSGQISRGAVRLMFSRRLLNGLFLVCGDLLALTLALLLASTLRVALMGNVPDGPWLAGGWFVGDGAVPGLIPFLWLAWVVGAMLMGLLPGWGLAAPTELQRVTQLCALVFAAVTGVVFMTQQGDMVSRLSLTLGLILSCGLVVLVRAMVKRLLLRADLWGVPAVIYGAAVTGTLMVQALRDNPTYGYRPSVILDDNPLVHGSVILGVPVIGPVDTMLRNWDLRSPVAIVAMPGLDRGRLVQLLEGPLAHYPKVVIVPDLFEIESLWVKANDFGGVLGLEVARNLLDPMAQAVKRVFDLLAVVLSAPIWLPICGLLALLIWLEDRTNPVFMQRRVGLHGQTFATWKFRTMLPDAEEVLRRTLESDAELRLEWETHFKLRRDPRITRIGALLRKTSLDELPQLFNVLMGQMSLVGPRPLPAYHQSQLSAPAQRLRVMVRPGMTGLWQVSGRSEAGNLGMERWDPYYVRNWSIWLDLVILMRTVGVVLRGSGAY